jgi:hypothetical protein
MDQRLIETPEPDQVIVVYDERTGQVRHVHQEINLPGGRAAPADEVTKRAIDMAQGMGDVGSPAGKLAGIALSGDDRRLLHQRGAALKVDAATRRLVATHI